jgi:DNA (cytosine-5)-methyltransferase 1
MKHGSLFSGIGGFDLAAEWMGWENMFHCEWNEFGQKILKHYWSNAISYGDITKTDFTIWRGRVDILTGGVPCQPSSVAGQRKGEEDDRWLWPQMLRVVREVKPPFVICENPPGIISLGHGKPLKSILLALENEGYSIELFIIPACSLQAPHKRERVWIVAYSDSNRKMVQRRNRDSDNKKWNPSAQVQERGDKQFGSVVSNTKRIITNPGLQRQKINDEQTTRVKQRSKGVSTDTNNQRLERYGGFVELQESNIHPSACYSKPSWDNFPTQSPLCSRDDGISSKLDGITFPKWRNESIKAYGNAIVPQVAYQIFKAIEESKRLLELK